MVITLQLIPYYINIQSGFGTVPAPPYARVCECMQRESARSVALSFFLCLLLVAVQLVSCKQFTLNVPQVRGGEEGCKTDAFGAVVASRRHCVLTSRQAKTTTFHRLVLSKLAIHYDQLTGSLALCAVLQ